MNRARHTVAWLICFAALALVACASPLTTARKSVSAAATLGTAAGTMFAAVDAQKEEAIATKLFADHDVPSAEKARDAWRTQRTNVVRALRVYDATVVASGAAVTLAGQKLDLGALLGTLASSYVSLQGAFTAFGIALPKVGL